MEIKMRVGRWYKLSDGRVVGPAKTWTTKDVVPHYFELPVESASRNKETIFCEDGSTEYADFYVAEEVAPPSFVEAGGFYRTNSGIVVGPMVLTPGYDDVFKSERDELKAINGLGYPLRRGQQWNHDGSVQFANRYEDGHKLVERLTEEEAHRVGWYSVSAAVEGAPTTDTDDAPFAVVEDGVLRIELSAKGFGEAFKIVAGEFEKRISEAVKVSEEREAEIERLTGELETMKNRRDEWFEAWRKTEERKQRGDARLRAARQRLKAEKCKLSILELRNGVLASRLARAESGERSKKVKAVVDAIGGVFLLVGVAVVTWALVA